VRTNVVNSRVPVQYFASHGVVSWTSCTARLIGSGLRFFSALVISAVPGFRSWSSVKVPEQGPELGKRVLDW
jgi:hypothetical protein